MSQHIVVSLNGHHGGWRWWFAEAIDQVYQQDETPLPDLAPDAEILFIAPGADILLTSVELPKMSHLKLQKALPYALEDQVADDVTELHFAMASERAGQRPVAIVKKKLITKWHQTISQIVRADTKLAGLIPETLTIPLFADGWTVVVNPEMALVRTGSHQGFTVDRCNLMTVLQNYLSSLIERPQSLHVYCDDAAFLSEADQLALGLAVSCYPRAEADPDMRQLKNPEINLLQGEYKINSEVIPTKRLWQLSSAFVLAWLFIITSAMSFKTAYLRHEAQGLDQQILVVYKELFPNAKAVVSPRKRVTRLLASAKQSKQSGAFLRVLAMIAPVLANSKDTDIQELVFSDQEMQLLIETEDFTVLDALTKQIKQLGLRVEQKGATKVANKIKAQLVIKETV